MCREAPERDPAVPAALDQPRESGHAYLVEVAHERHVDDDVSPAIAAQLVQQVARGFTVEGTEDAEDATATLDPMLHVNPCHGALLGTGSGNAELGGRRGKLRGSALAAED